MIRRDIIVTMLVFCLAVALLFVLPTSSSSGIEGYDPWVDLDDNGVINMKDIGWVARLFTASGAAVNKTALLLDVNNTFTTLLSRMDSLNSSLINLESKVDSLNATNLMPLIDSLNASLIELQSRVNGLNSTVTQLQQSETSLQTSLSQLQSSVDALNNTLSSQIGSLEAQIFALGAAIARAVTPSTLK